MNSENEMIENAAISKRDCCRCSLRYSPWKVMNKNTTGNENIPWEGQNQTLNTRIKYFGQDNRLQNGESNQNIIISLNAFLHLRRGIFHAPDARH